ncbi:hypothetical protein [Pseudoalteromonas aurantia]|uniref:Uncharacterized protein n=1 Tax=Pseudoalteromonas aurantia 208 TaxID=1314867 RepID=A0ABR9EHI2_9GAMM|nr:hypothetical protein [Pseudoalteromonas aurantia]MBE0370455.1 hypothetical protein [Pseudoalteromonas aurantia 208]
MSNYIKIESVELENVNRPNSFILYQSKSLLDLDFSNPEFERYGGRGLNSHGGGARAANYGHYQVKGVGLTPLAGVIEGVNYNHGTVPLEEALLEAIYSEVLANVLPVGVADFYGVIYTGQNTAFEFNEDRKESLVATHGALIVREKAIRPAHFMRTNNFKIQEKYQAEVISDVHRIRNVIHALADSFDSHDQFIEYVGEFLQGCAEQFGFAHIAGITHGAMTPSNILMDGRWIDLVTPSFIDRGRNYRVANLTFYHESSIAIEVSQELCDTYSKFTGISFDTSILHDYFKSSLALSIDYHLPYVLGLDREIATSIDNDSKVAPLYHRLKSLFKQESKVYFTHHLDDEHSVNLCRDIINVVDTVLYTKESAEEHLYRYCYLHYKHKDTINFRGFVAVCLIKALKRDLLAKLYYRTKVESCLQKLSEKAIPSQIKFFVESYKASSLWVFDDTFLDSEILYQSTDKACSLVFDADKMIVSTTRNKNTHFTALVGNIADLPCDFFRANSLIFGEYFDNIDKLLRKLSNEQ